MIVFRWLTLGLLVAFDGGRASILVKRADPRDRPCGPAKWLGRFCYTPGVEQPAEDGAASSSNPTTMDILHDPLQPVVQVGPHFLDRCLLIPLRTGAKQVKLPSSSTAFNGHDVLHVTMSCPQHYVCVPAVDNDGDAHILCKRWLDHAFDEATAKLPKWQQLIPDGQGDNFGFLNPKLVNPETRPPPGFKVVQVYYVDPIIADAWGPAT